MPPTTLEAKVYDFLAQKRIAVLGVSRDNSHHPAGTLIHHRLKKTAPAGTQGIAASGCTNVGKGSSVSRAAAKNCRQHDISVIAGACPMMFGRGIDFGDTCMRFFMKLTGGLPT
jgi:uncharacterized protein